MRKQTLQDIHEWFDKAPVPMYKAWDKKKKVMCKVWAIDWKGWDEGNEINMVTVEGPDGTYELSEHEVILLKHIGFRDRDGRRIYEGDIYLGKQHHMGGDGRLKKGFPDTIKVICVVRSYKGNYQHPEIIGPIKEHIAFRKEYQYRSINYRIDPLSKGITGWNAGTEKFDTPGDDVTCHKIKIIGNVFEDPEYLEL